MKKINISPRPIINHAKSFQGNLVNHTSYLTDCFRFRKNILISYHIALGQQFQSASSNTTFVSPFICGSQEDRDNASFGPVPYPGGPINIEEIGEDLESDIDLEDDISPHFSDNESIDANRSYEDDSGKSLKISFLF